jgi:hypothetical protein
MVDAVVAGKTWYDCYEEINVCTMDTTLELSPTKNVFFKEIFSTNNNQMVIEDNPLNDEFDISPI